MTVTPGVPIGGGGGTDANPTDGFIPLNDGTNTFADSAIEETATLLISGKTIQAPGASLLIGTNVVMSSHGEQPQFSAPAYGEEYLPVLSFHDDSGSEVPKYTKLAAAETVDGQPDFLDGFSGPILQFTTVPTFFRGTEFGAPFGSLFLSVTLKGNGVKTEGLRITVRINSHTGKPIYQSHNDVQWKNGEGYTVDAFGDKEIRFDDPLIARTGDIMYVTFDVNTDFDPLRTISLKGLQTTEFDPYSQLLVQEIIKISMLLEGDNVSALVNDVGYLTSVTKADVGLGNVDNTSDVNKPVSTAQQNALDLKEDKSQKGIANGYADLDSGGQVPLSQIPASIQGGITVIGFWNAATNTPDLSALTLDQGQSYQVSVAGSTNINGETNWKAKDLVVWSDDLAGNWFKLDNTDDVLSVNAKTGAVVLDTSDINEVINLYYTEARVTANANVTANTSHRGNTANPHGTTKTQLGLGSVDNTSDVNKPVSTATQTALDLKANKDGDTLTTTSVNSVTLDSGQGSTKYLNGSGNYTTPPDTNSVTSVNTKIGAVVLDKTDIGLSVVDNTSDAGKPISTATQTALDLKAQSGDNVSIFANDAGYITSVGATSWGAITGTLSDQTDLQSVLNTKVESGYNVSIFVNDSNYTSSGDNVSSFVNDAGYLTSVTTNWGDLGGTLSNQTDLQLALDAKSKAGDNVSDFVNDSSYLTSVTKADVGLGNVDNTSDVNKPISTAQAAAFGQVDSVVAGNGVTVDATDAKNPIVSTASVGSNKLYAAQVSNNSNTNTSLNNWIQIVVAPTVYFPSADFTHDGAGVFTYIGTDPKTFDFEAGLSQMGASNDKQCEFAWFKNNATEMMGRQTMDMSTSKFYGSVIPSAVVTLSNGENLRVCIRNLEDSLATKIIHNWFKIKEW